MLFWVVKFLHKDVTLMWVHPSFFRFTFPSNFIVDDLNVKVSVLRCSGWCVQPNIVEEMWTNRMAYQAVDNEKEV